MLLTETGNAYIPTTCCIRARREFKISLFVFFRINVEVKQKKPPRVEIIESSEEDNLVGFQTEHDFETKKSKAKLEKTDRRIPRE